MSNHPFSWKSSVTDCINDKRVAVRAKMDTQNIQLLAIGNDTPIERHIVRKEAELDESAELPNHLQALNDSVWMTGRLDVNVASVAACHLLDYFHDVFFQRIHDDVGTELFSEFQAFR